ncbi:restriction endonuclease subunit S [Corynebacterium alimapuense]|uniref:Type I restriction modification DNA specificity domain-containing protein n=1 Tax=Corynebacterium alimapuense TaxID=1576874 RepID=A0A3M8K7Y5_9CORY|nr:restriction endonuclease subunit S [Corynebacterium alimapuense]RNE48865.1 hypothetical protein C5L39_06105 [Corynebacterium alimapuense]
MKAVDISDWGEVLVADLFERIERGRGSGAGSFMDGDIPYIAASFANNGYVRDVEDIDGSLTSDGNCIAMIVNGNGGVGRNTYQAEPFVGSSDLQLGYHHRMNQWNGLFLVACLNKSIERYNYSFAWKRTGEAFAKETVFLPVFTDGSPDWDTMEQTMRSIVGSQESKLRLIDELANSKPVSVDVDAWREFRIEDIFDIHSTLSGIDKNRLNQTPGDIPYVTRSGGNNAVSMYVTDDQDPRYQKESGNVITVGLDTQTVCYQPVPFYTGQNVHTIAHEKFNIYNALFVVACIKAVLGKYNWANGATLGRLRQDFVSLPIDASGDPDWEYMESTMKALLEKKATDLYVLEQLLPLSEVQEVV